MRPNRGIEIMSKELHQHTSDALRQSMSLVFNLNLTAAGSKTCFNSRVRHKRLSVGHGSLFW